MRIERFVTVGETGYESDHEHGTLDAAIAAAQAEGPATAVVMRPYVPEETELVWTPHGGSGWPNKGQRLEDVMDARAAQALREGRIDELDENEEDGA